MLSPAELPAVGTSAAARKRYARIPEVLPVPNLIELQLESFKWFIDKGLRELFDEISPIKDFTGKVMELQFLRLRVRGARSTPSRSAGPRTSPSAGRSTSTSSS